MQIRCQKVLALKCINVYLGIKLLELFCLLKEIVYICANHFSKCHFSFLYTVDQRGQKFNNLLFINPFLFLWIGCSNRKEKMHPAKINQFWKSLNCTFERSYDYLKRVLLSAFCDFSWNLTLNIQTSQHFLPYRVKLG